MKKSLMRKSLTMFAAILCCLMSVTTFTACSEDEETSFAIYSYGFDSMGSTSTSFIAEMTVIEGIFEDYFESELGVTESPFSCDEGDSAVIAVCQQAATLLNQQTFEGHYVYVVNKTTGSGTTAIFTWEN